MKDTLTLKTPIFIGTTYSVHTGKLINDPNYLEETREDRTARILTEIGNSVQAGIVMEEDL